MKVWTGNTAPPQVCDFIRTISDPSDHAHVTFSIRRNEARQPNMIQEHLWPISEESEEGKGQHLRGPLLSRQAVIGARLWDAQPALTRPLPSPFLDHEQYQTVVWTVYFLFCFVFVFLCKLDPFLIGLRACFAEGRPGFGLDRHMSAPQGVCSVGQDFENSKHLLILPVSTFQDLIRV